MKAIDFTTHFESTIETSIFIDRICVFQGESSSDDKNVPSSFVKSFSELLGMLISNLDLLCQKNHGILLTGLYPSTHIRMLNEKIHFCCALEYEIHPTKKLHHVSHRTQSHFIIIDFSTGEVFNENVFLSHQFSSITSLTELLGRLTEETLKKCWKNALDTDIFKYKNPIGGHFFLTAQNHATHNDLFFSAERTAYKISGTQLHHFNKKIEVTLNHHLPGLMFNRVEHAIQSDIPSVKLNYSALD